MRALAIAMLTIVAGCASREVYELSSNDSWAAYASSCAGPLGTYERRLGDGVALLLHPRWEDGVSRVGLLFQLEPGRTLQLTSPNIEIVAPDGLKRTYALDRLRSGLQSDISFLRPYNVPFVDYEATSMLTGTERFAKVPPPIGPRDRYETSIPIGNGRVSKFSLQLPSIRSNGFVQTLQPVTFEYRQVSYVKCLQ